MTEFSARPSTIPQLYPLTFDPVFKDYVWGGRNLADKLGRVIPDGIVAESWEIAAHPDGSSIVNNGPLAGMTLPAVQALLGLDLVGRRNQAMLALGRFPLLIKLLDAQRWLSVQVHPDDTYGLAHEQDLGKTEMWVVLHAEPGAELIYGFKPGVTKEIFAQAIDDGNVDPWLHRVPVQVDDVVFVPAGTVHALGPGILVAEIQQNSNTTYRIYDWGRPRPIHRQQSLDVLNFDLIEPGLLAPTLLSDHGIRRELIGTCRYFQTERLILPGGATYATTCDGESCEIWAVLSGEARVAWREESLCVQGVGWFLLPASLGAVEITATRASTLLRVVTPPQ